MAESNVYIREQRHGERVLLLNYVDNHNYVYRIHSQLLSLRAGIKSVAILMPILGIGWVFGIFAFQKDAGIVFQYLFAITNSLQVSRTLKWPLCFITDLWRSVVRLRMVCVVVCFSTVRCDVI